MKFFQNENNKFQFLIDLKINLGIIKKDFSLSKKKEAQLFLNEFQKKKCVDYIPILLQSKEEDLIFFGLQQLERMIDYHWRTLLSIEQNLLLGYVFRTVYDRNLLNFNFNLFSFCYQKLHHCLVKIILKLDKFEIFLFLKNLIEEAKYSEFSCETNISLINLLFENILLKENSNLRLIIETENQFSILLKKIENLCQYVLEKTYFITKSTPELLLKSLNCLESLVNISPFSYCFGEQLFIFLVLLCPQKITMNCSINCLIELANRENKENCQLSMKIFMNFLIQFQELLPVTNNIGEIYEDFTQENKQFISSTIWLFLSIFKNTPGSIGSTSFMISSFSLTNQLMIKFSCIPSIEIYKICLVWWLNVIDRNLIFYKCPIIFKILEKVFFELRILLICRMVKPEEVLIRENENGQIVRETVYDTESSEIYKKSKKALLFLANIDKEVTKEIILKKLTQIAIPYMWNRTILKSICWTIGSISDIFNSQIESSKIFFVTVLKNLLYLCELKKEKKNKAIIASNIMFVVGQYPRFLKTHWKFCKTVIEKLFEFVTEPMDIPGFKDMISDTFLIIGRECGEYISKDLYLERKIFIKWIFESYSKIKIVLKLRHKKQFLTSITYIVNHIPFENDKKYFASKISLELNQEWVSIPERLELDLLENSISYKQKLSFWIKVNIKILNILKTPYFEEFEYIAKNFYFLIETISFKLLGLIKKRKEFLDSSKIKLFYTLKKSLFEMLLQLIVIFNKKNSSDEFDIYCLRLITPICSAYNEQKYTGFIDQLVLSFSAYLLQAIDFLNSPNSLRKLFKETITSSIENKIFSLNSTEPSSFKIFKLLKALLITQFKSLLKIDPNPSISEKIFKNLIIYLGAGIEHKIEIICEFSINTLEELMELITGTNLERYFFLNYSEMFISKLINCSYETIALKSKKSIIKIVLKLVSVFKTFSDFNIFSITLVRLFSNKFSYHTRNEIYQFVLLIYTYENNSLLEEKLKIYLQITDFNSISSENCSLLIDYSLSEIPIIY